MITKETDIITYEAQILLRPAYGKKGLQGMAAETTQKSFCLANMPPRLFSFQDRPLPENIITAGDITYIHIYIYTHTHTHTV